MYLQRGTVKANIPDNGCGVVGGNGEKGIMKIILIVVAVLLFAFGYRFIDDYSEDWYSTLGIVLMFVGMLVGMIGLMMIPPM